MSRTSCEAAIVEEMAARLAKRITRRVVADLQTVRVTLSGDDSGLENAWEEICVQIQCQDSFFWDAYDDTVRSFVVGRVGLLARDEKDALWLQTEAGFDWRFDHGDNRESVPLVEDEIVDHLVRKYVYPAAEAWANHRIRRFLDRTG